MLNKNQANVLEHILCSNEELITDTAKENGVNNSDASIGVAQFLIGDPENFSKMSKNQKYHYDNAIKPLINNVPCDGMLGTHEDGSSSCIGNDYIEEDNLLIAYQTDDMRCQQCIYTTNAWHANNP